MNNFYSGWNNAEGMQWVQDNWPSTSFSMSFSTISTVLTLTRPVSSSVYSSVLVVTVSPTTRSDSLTLVGPGECRTASLGKSSLEGRKHCPTTPNDVSFTTLQLFMPHSTLWKGIPSALWKYQCIDALEKYTLHNVKQIQSCCFQSKKCEIKRNSNEKLVIYTYNGNNQDDSTFNLVIFL